MVTSSPSLLCHLLVRDAALAARGMARRAGGQIYEGSGLVVGFDLSTMSGANPANPTNFGTVNDDVESRYSQIMAKVNFDIFLFFCLSF